MHHGDPVPALANGQKDIDGKDENILLLGTDHSNNGQPGRSSDRHSDSMMLLHTDPGRHRLVYLSIPRDLRVNVPGHGYDKINSAFQLGGLPISLADLKAAMGRQGKAAAGNREAFEWGRWAVHDPDAVAEVLDVAARDDSGAAVSIFDPSPGALATAADLFSVVESGAVRIEVNQSYPLAEAARAHRDLEGRRTTGSTVFLP